MLKASMTWDFLKNLSLPLLQSLNTRCVPIEALVNLIENTNGCLSEIIISHSSVSEIDNKRIIQAIYKNCSNLRYLKLPIRNDCISELEKLLINCQYLDGLFIFIYNTTFLEFSWDHLFEILAKSSPTSLFKFKFDFYDTPDLKSIKLFLDNWKGRQPMLLHTIQINFWKGIGINNEYFDLMQNYKTQGIIKNYNHVSNNATFEYFEWVQRKKYLQ